MRKLYLFPLIAEGRKGFPTFSGNNLPTRRLFSLILLLFITVIPAPELRAAGSLKGAYIEIADRQEAYQTFARSVSERVLVPVFQTFALQSDHLFRISQEFCDSGRTAKQLSTLKTAWNSTMTAWMQTQPFRFGPAKDEFVDLKIQFWPDEKDLVRFNVNQLLAIGQALDATQLSSASAPAQGLPAMEFLLFGAGDGQTENFDNRRCDYLKAAAENLRNQARSLTSAWGGPNHGFLREFAYSNDPLGATLSLETLLLESLTALEIIKNDKLAKPLGIDTGNFNSLFLESWRSRHSQKNIVSNLITLQRIFFGGSYFGLDDLLIINFQDAQLEFNLRTQIAKCLAIATSLPAPLFDQLKSGDARNGAEMLHTELTILISLLKNNLARVLGISIGFNENDGD